MAIRSGVDASKLSALAARPGIDPRIWLSYAVITDIAYDEKHGMFADIQLLPDGDKETALIGTGYSGNNYGAWGGLKVGHTVLVAMPMGDPSVGPVILARIFTGTELPPAEFKNENSGNQMDATTNPVLRVEDGATLRVVAKAGATISFEVETDAKINLVAKGTGTIAITGESTIEVDSPNIILGKGGAPIATVGDLVAVSIPPLLAGVNPVIPVPPIVADPSGAIPAVGQIISGRGNITGG